MYGPTLASLLLCGVLTAQAGWGGGLINLKQATREANSDRSVALIASHPDDRYVMPACYLKYRFGYRVSVVLFTRGEGGQNSLGPELGTELGERRTLETEACADRLGFEVHYLDARDAGYCRTAAEAFEIWGRQPVTEALATALRRIRPDVVLTTHGPSETHGHDLALLEVLPEAITRCAESNFVTPGLAPHSVARAFRGASDGELAELHLDMDLRDATRGATYRRMAYEAMTQSHRTQAPFQPMDRLFEPELRLVQIPITEMANASLTDNLPSLFGELRRSEAVPAALSSQLQFNLESLPGLATDRLRDLYRRALWIRGQLSAIDRETGSPLDQRILRRIEALDRVLWLAHGLSARVLLPSDPVVVPNQAFNFEVDIHLGGSTDVEVLDVGGDRIRTLGNRGTRHGQRFRVEQAPDPIRRRPSSMRRASFRSPRYRRPVQPRLLVRFAAGTARLADGSSRSYGMQEVSVPIRVEAVARPPIEIQVTPPALLVPAESGPITFNVLVTRHGNEDVLEDLRIRVPAGATASDPMRQVRLVGARTQQSFDFVFGPSRRSRPGVHRISVRCGTTRAQIPVHRIDVRLRQGLRVAVIAGPSPVAARILRSMGASVTLLTETNLPWPVEDFDTILVDTRALRSQGSARAGFESLIEFARAGGRLVLLYHKSAEFNPESSGHRYYPSELPLWIGSGRVTRKDAPVTLLDPGHPLLSRPNQIQPSDWDGWTQERGLYFPAEYADGYDELIALADPGQPVEKGSLLYARVGAGEYVYCALSLFRQLHIQHPGACRLLANLVSPEAQ